MFVCLVHLSFAQASFFSRWSLNSDLIPFSKSSHDWNPTSFCFHRVSQVFHHGYTFLSEHSLPAVMTLASSPAYFDGATRKQRSSSKRNFFRCFGLPSKASGNGMLGSLALAMYQIISAPASTRTRAAGGVSETEASSWERFLPRALPAMSSMS